MNSIATNVNSTPEIWPTRSPKLSNPSAKPPRTMQTTFFQQQKKKKKKKKRLDKENETIVLAF
jgi:hypothetical protein